MLLYYVKKRVIKSSKGRSHANRRFRDLEYAFRKKHFRLLKHKDRRRWAYEIAKYRLKTIRYYWYLRHHHLEREAARRAGERYGYGPSTIRAFAKKYREGGKKALMPFYQIESPPQSPIPMPIIELILYLRHRLGWGGKRIAKQLTAMEIYTLSHTTVYKVFRRFHVRTKTYHPRGKRDGIAYRRFAKKAPNDLWHLDFFGPFENETGQKYWVLLIIDDHSRFMIDLRVVTSLSSELTISILKTCFETYEKPKAIMTDNATTFVSVWENGTHVFQTFLKENNIKHERIPPYYPQANGKAEAAVKIVKREAVKPFFSDQEIRGTIWTQEQLQISLDHYRRFYNHCRLHGGIDWQTPVEKYDNQKSMPVPLTNCKL